MVVKTYIYIYIHIIIVKFILSKFKVMCIILTVIYIHWFLIT